MFQYILIISLIFISSCKTREDIQREQLVDGLATQMQDGQKLQTDFVSRLQGLEEKLNTITGKVEEGDHQTAQTIEQRMLLIEGRLNVIEESSKSNTKNYENLSAKIDAQDKYLKKVLSTLNKIGRPKKSSKAKKKVTPYNSAMALYKAGKYKESKKKLLSILDSKSLSAQQNTRILHNLGMIEYIKKNNIEALGYFTRLFSEYPKSTYNKRGLLTMGKTFVRMKKKEEAKAVLESLIKQFPKASQIKEAKAIMQKL